MTDKRNFLLGIACGSFIAFEGLMFYLIHILRADIDFNLHYSCIIATAVFSTVTLLIKMLTAKEENESISEIIFDKKDGNLLRIAMLFTLAADYFLVVLSEKNRLAGVTFFLGTQLFVFLHIMVNDDNPRLRRIHITTRLGLMAILIIAAYATLGETADALAIFSVIYYSNLCTNAIFAHRSGKGGIILTIGLILFALCDINVGLSVLNDMYVGGFPEGSLLYELINADVNLIWVFYIPSQTLISLTLIMRGKESDK